VSNLEVSAGIGGQRTETITFTPEQLEIVRKAGAALRNGRTVDPATGEITTPATRVTTPAGQLPESVLDALRPVLASMGTFPDV